VNGLAEAGLPVVRVETRHMKALLKAQQTNKRDRNDARGIAQMMRVGLFKPVHVKTLASQERRMLLTSRLCDDPIVIDGSRDREADLRRVRVELPEVVRAGRPWTYNGHSPIRSFEASCGPSRNGVWYWAALSWRGPSRRGRTKS
jgi:hypothetical protein